MFSECVSRFLGAGRYIWKSGGLGIRAIALIRCTRRNLEHARTGKVVFEDLARTLGIRNVHVIDPTAQFDEFQKLIQSCLEKPELSVVIARRDCLLAARSIREFERCNEQQAD